MKIAICGKMCSGKTTIANLIKEYDNRYEIFSFGKKVKVIANELFGMDLNNKNRSLMVQIGTKMREIDLNVWANYIINETKDKEFCIIDDLRFQNELDKDTYQDHINNKNHLSEKNDLVFKSEPIIIDSSNDLNYIKNIIYNSFFKK